MSSQTDRNGANSPAPLLDATGFEILRQLAEDGRRPFSAIASSVGLSEAAVGQRVRALISSGVLQIVGVTDPLKLGYGTMALVQVAVDGDLDSVADAITARDEVDYCLLTSGRFEIFAEVVCRDHDHLLALTSAIRAVPGVRLLETTICLRMQKQNYTYAFTPASA
jgi:Lrp/AsnC family transcriptional regulator for asnA, asnC and gidA